MVTQINSTRTAYFILVFMQGKTPHLSFVKFNLIHEYITKQPTAIAINYTNDNISPPMSSRTRARALTSAARDRWVSS